MDERKMLKGSVEQKMQDILLKFTQKLCVILHADSHQTDDGTVEVKWQTTKNHMLIEAHFKVIGHDHKHEHNALVDMKLLGEQQGTLIKLIQLNLSMNVTTVRGLGDLHNITKKLEFLHFLGAINTEIYYEIHFILSLIALTDGALYFIPSYINEMICVDEELQYHGDQSILVEFVELYGVDCGHPGIFKDLDDETRDKMIKKCMDENREDLADILRQNKND